MNRVAVTSTWSRQPHPIRPDVDFCAFFLSSCVDQVIFMESLFEPAELQRRMEIWCEEETRADRYQRVAGPLLREAVLAGEFARGKAA